MKKLIRFAKRSSRRFQKGSALLVALMTMVGLSLLGLAFVALSETENAISINEQNHTQTVAVAEAGAKLVLQWFQDPEEHARPRPDAGERRGVQDPPCRLVIHRLLQTIEHRSASLRPSLRTEEQRHASTARKTAPTSGSPARTPPRSSMRSTPRFSRPPTPAASPRSASTRRRS